MKRFLLAWFILCLAVPAAAQTPNWVANPTVGYPGNNVTSEIFTDTQGGDPPALASEPADVDEGTNYVRSQWISGTNISRMDQGEAKFRTNCSFAKFGTFDPILYPGQPNAGHPHTFFGNKAVTASSDYNSLRAAPASTCSGGPLNATAYWEPSLLYEVKPGVVVPVKPNAVTFYYTRGSYTFLDRNVRFLNNFHFIGGVNPMDPTNSIRLNELPAGFDKQPTRPALYDGYSGIQCYRITDGVTIDPTGPGVFPDYDQHYSRFLINPDGSDPWNGQCEGPNYRIIFNVSAPPCWNGTTLGNSTGRDYVRYPAYKTGFGSSDDTVCPDHWYWTLQFEAKTEFPAYTFAMRSKMYLSSDRMPGMPVQTPGSTFHFDWWGAWDRQVLNTWLAKCGGETINGVAGDPLTCGNSTISATQRLLVGENSPNVALSNNPVMTVLDLGATGTASKARFGSVIPGTGKVNATICHPMCM